MMSERKRHLDMQKETADAYTLSQGKHWLWTAGKLGDQGGITPCWIRVNDGAWILVKKDSGGARVFFPDQTGKADLNYKGVAEQAGTYIQNDKQTAYWMLKRIAGKNGNEVPDKSKPFLDALLLLMLGVETSRFLSGLATTVLFLHLIQQDKAYGRTGKKFGFKNAFHTDSWEDGQWYGGKFPYATHGTGAGNSISRRDLKNDKSLDFWNYYVNLPQRHAVPRREVSLFIHWLEARCGEEKCKSLTEAEARTELETILSGIYSNDKFPAKLMYSPNPFSGVHAFGQVKGDKQPSPTDSSAKVWIHDGKHDLALYFHYSKDADCGRSTGRGTGLDTNLQLFKDEPKQAEPFGGHKDPNASGYLLRREATANAQAQAKLDGAWMEVTLEQAWQKGRKQCPKCWL